MMRGDWHASYEAAAHAEAARYAGASDDELQRVIRGGRTGEYHTLWREAARRRASPALCWLLHEVLVSQRPYLERYHAAAALLQLLGCRAFEPVELAAAWPARAANLERLRAVVAAAVGAPPAGEPS